MFTFLHCSYLHLRAGNAVPLAAAAALVVYYVHVHARASLTHLLHMRAWD